MPTINLSNIPFEDLKKEYNKRIKLLYNKPKQDTCKNCCYYATGTDLSILFKIPIKIHVGYCMKNCSIDIISNKIQLQNRIKTPACTSKIIGVRIYQK